MEPARPVMIRFRPATLVDSAHPVAGRETRCGVRFSMLFSALMIGAPLAAGADDAASQAQGDSSSTELSSYAVPAAESILAQTRQPEEERRAARQTKTPLKWPDGKRGKVILMWEHLVDDNAESGGEGDREFEDFTAFVSYKQAHFQVWTGEFTDGAEIGGYLRDRRRSTYSGLYRFRNNFDHVLQFDTEQVLGKGWVSATMLRGIRVLHHDAAVAEAAGTDLRVGEETQFQFGQGFYWYYGDYNFLTSRAVSDPREGGRWTFISSNRFHHSENIYVEPGWIIRTDRSTGWFFGGKIKYFRWLVGDFDRFDWTDTDRTVYSAGVEIPF